MNTNRTRIHPALLAAVTSVLATIIAVVAHAVVGIGEVPIVIGTIVVASIIGWINASTQGTPQASPVDGGHGQRDFLHAA